jgi:hypothetical protein
MPKKKIILKNIRVREGILTSYSWEVRWGVRWGARVSRDVWQLWQLWQILAIAKLCRAISLALQGNFEISCAHLQGNFKI